MMIRWPVSYNFKSTQLTVFSKHFLHLTKITTNFLPQFHSQRQIRRMHQTIDYGKYMTSVANKRQPSAIRALQPLLQIPGMISLGGGMPNPSTFPFSQITATLKDGQQLHLSEEETAKALQYSATNGIPEFVDLLMRLQTEEHAPPYSDFGICVTNGSQEGISKAFEMMVSPGDNVLVECPLYSGTLAILRPMDCNLVPVATDENGVIPDELDKILSVDWTGKRKPKILYTVPTASNPTGVTTSLERKQQIYKVAKKHDIIIFEDDPYYYLQFTPTRMKSFLSMDVDGRVLRFDSFSKILSAGMRIGFVTGPKPLINGIVLHSQASNLHANGLSQMLAWKLIADQWKFQGFFDHIEKVSAFYKDRCDHLVECLTKNLKGKAEWNVPAGGMFVWIKLTKVPDTKQLIQEKAVKEKVLCLPGAEFMPDDKMKVGCQYIRAAFSTATKEQISEAIERLAKLLP